MRQTKTEQLLAILTARITETWTTSVQLLSLFKVKKPSQIPSDKWDELQAKLAARRFATFSAALELERSPLDYLERQDLQGLEQEMVQRLRARAYRLQLGSLADVSNEQSAREFLRNPKPAWLSDADYDRYRRRAETTIRAADGERISGIVLRTTHCILAGKPIDTKAVGTLDGEWQQELEKLDSQIRVAKETNTTERASIANDSEEVAKLKTKILRQLEVLHHLLLDPASIERIEPYDNPFAAGNLEILRRISLAMREDRS